MTAPTRSRAEIGRANAAKGKLAERQLVTYLRAHGFPGAERTVRTGYRVEGRISADRGDIDGTPGLAWQVKAVQESRLHRVPEWLADTAAQAAQSRADLGVLVVKRTGHASPGEWWAFLDLRDLVDLLASRGANAARLVPDRFCPVRFQLGHLLPVLHQAGYGAPPAPLAGAESAQNAREGS